MSQNDNYLKILEKITDVQTAVARVETRTENLEVTVKGIQEEDKRQNELLAEHIAGVQTAQARLSVEVETRDALIKEHENKSQARFEEMDKRLQIVEFLPNLMTGIWKVIKWVGIPAGAILTIIKVIEHFSK